MKGYLVSGDGAICYVLAENAAKARYKAYKTHEEDACDGTPFFDSWAKDASVRREKSLDGESFDRAQVMVLGRMWDDCPQCRETHYPEDGPVFLTVGGQWYCSVDCWRDAGEPEYGLAKSCGTALCLYPE